MGRLCSSKKLKMEGGGGDADEMMDLSDDKGTREDAAEVAAHESNLPNEILSTIFGNLDFQRLKQVRLVCKRWNQATEFHLKTRSIVPLYIQDDCYSRIKEFLKFRGMEKSLSEPFQTISVDLGRMPFTIPSQQHLYTLILPASSLVLTRLSTRLLPLKLTLQLLREVSSTLEYLKLDSGSSDDGYLPPTDTQQCFPKLWGLALEHSSKPLWTSRLTHFPATVAWITSASPNLTVFLNGKFSGGNSRILLKLDLKTVETLGLSFNGLSVAALERLISTPFSRLKNLKLFNCTSNLDTIAGIVRTARATLKSLNLYGMRSGVERLADWDFPLCPNVEELTLHSFPDQERYLESLQFLTRNFPRLQLLNVLHFFVRNGFDWSSVSPFSHVKTLRIWEVRNDGRDTLPGELLFFQKFPALVTLYVKPTALVKLCTLKDVELLDGVKHLGYFRDHDYTGPAVDSSCLPVLKGIETITFVKPSKAVLALPVKDMPCLKLIRFPWSYDLKLENLLEMVKGVEMRLVITNCCSIQRSGGPRLKELLQEFFASPPKAECGCKEWELCSSHPWSPNEGVVYFKSSN